jgi:hypothetical protein
MQQVQAQQGGKCDACHKPLLKTPSAY